MNKRSCLIIAGEKSGEDHAMSFFPALKEKVPECDFFGVGGDVLAEYGVELLFHLKDFSSIGISEVLAKIPFYLKAKKRLIAEVRRRRCKTAILVDFQGFNLSIAKQLKKEGVEVLYYVAPQAWVWKPWRAKVLQENVHTLFTILPFEKQWFQERRVTKVKSVIHPLMVEYAQTLKNKKFLRNYEGMSQRSRRILLLPGSRNMEVRNLGGIFKSSLEAFKNETGLSLEIGLVKVESVDPEIYNELISRDWKIFEATQLTAALDWGDISLAASGTVTLATGLFALPTIVCYRISWLSEMIFSFIIPYNGPVSLTNIIHQNKYVFPEYLQDKVNPENIIRSLKSFLLDQHKYDETVALLKNTQKLLSGDDFCLPSYMAAVILGERA